MILHDISYAIVVCLAAIVLVILIALLIAVVVALIHVFYDAIREGRNDGSGKN